MEPQGTNNDKSNASRNELAIGMRVRRNGDKSGTSRTVTDIDHGIVFLDDWLYGWKAWDALMLERVPETKGERNAR